MAPPTKKRKTQMAGSVARRTTRSQRPTLSIEVIGKVASFAQYGDDLMNICKAVGRKDSAVIQHICLRNNMGFLRYTLENFTAKFRSTGDSYDKTRGNIFAWMKINTDWRKYCTLERTEDEEIATVRWQNEEGERVVSTNPLVLFNNPAVAIEFGLVDVLKHLVEEVGIDINSYAWSGLLAQHRHHLLYVAVTIAEGIGARECLDYILSRTETDVRLPCSGQSNGNQNPMWEAMMFVHCSCDTFRAVVEHRSFHPNQFDGDVAQLPVFSAFATGLERANEGDPIEGIVEKFKILLEVGADPEVNLGGGLSPLGVCKTVLSRYDFSGRSPLCVSVGRQMIAAMEEKRRRWI